jgi:hypothetical protein
MAAFDSAEIHVPWGATVAIVLYSEGDKRPLDCSAFSLVQVGGGYWPGDLPEVVHEFREPVATVTGLSAITEVYVVRKRETDEAIGVFTES